MVRESHFLASDDLRRYEMLLQMADLMVDRRGLPELLPDLTRRLHAVASFDVANFALYDPGKKLMRMQLWEESGLSSVADLPLEEAACGVALEKQEPVVWPDLDTESRFPRSINLLREKGIRSYCALPLTSSQRRLEVMGLGSSQIDAYQDDDVRLLRRVAELIALALENALTRAAFQHEKECLEALLQASTTLVSNLDFPKVFAEISGFIRKVLSQDYTSVALHDEQSRCLRIYALDSSLADELIGTEMTLSLRESGVSSAFLSKEVKIFSYEELAQTQSEFIKRMLRLGVKSLCCVPLITSRDTIGTLNLASKEVLAFLPQDLSFLKQVAAQVGMALDNTRAYREIAQLTDRLKKEKLYLEDEIRSELNFEEIIGESPALRRVLAQVDTVARSDATVLILGETGTGKELIARAIHRLSPRKDEGFIKLNCAAIPTGLLESELFGHEKGAFTGAVSQKIGRLELADHGTLFLDEVGDIPLELQPKLLRVLQDQEFERLGGTRTIRVNVRLIAATNRDLAKSMAANTFRSDLYYRLNVFPVHMPALRDRSEDIRMLVRYFVGKFGRRMNKQIDTIPKEAMNALTDWRWPGNVRELENFIERSVILSDGPVLRVPFSELRLPPEASSRGSVLESMEREYILKVLRETGGVIAGVNGAAARLGMKRTTLQSRIQKMGITRQEYEN
jgi:formate hydrogenlyase transcriptional activator